jgi:hypothetical protein
MIERGYYIPPMGVFRNVADVPKSRAFPAVKVRVLRPFYGLRRRLEVGEVVNLVEPDATDAVALGRAEYV